MWQNFAAFFHLTVIFPYKIQNISLLHSFPRGAMCMMPPRGKREGPALPLRRALFPCFS